MTARLTLAVHLQQDGIPPTGPGSSRLGLPPSAVPGSGSGYGPPLSDTPLSCLISSILYEPPSERAAPEPAQTQAQAQGWASGMAPVKTEYDLVCMPLTNPNWQSRWERMCTFTTSATEAELGLVPGQHHNQHSSRTDAELWRAGGGFMRNEVNITRSGKRSRPVSALSV